MEIKQRAVGADEMTVVHRQSDQPKYNPGRRAEIKYRDLGLEEATKGEIRAEIMEIKEGVSRPTGWHYHTADVQFLHMIKGWVKMEFGDTGVITLQAGDSITIPGGVVHQELISSDNMELLEISLPAKLGTVAVDAPEWGNETASTYSDELSHVQKLGHGA